LISLKGGSIKQLALTNLKKKKRKKEDPSIISDNGKSAFLKLYTQMLGCGHHHYSLGLKK
jgi:hypothetical protein